MTVRPTNRGSLNLVCLTWQFVLFPELGFRPQVLSTKVHSTIPSSRINRTNFCGTADKDWLNDINPLI